jgi:hypothetical protein
MEVTSSMDTTQELIRTALPYLEAEAEVARRFFASDPTPEEHEHWLRAQLWKELHPVDGYFSGLAVELHAIADMVPKIDTDVDRKHFGFLLQQMQEEFQHYVLMAELLELLLGRRVTPADGVQIPGEADLESLRRSFTTSGSELKKAAVLFTEGGGSRLFREGRLVQGGEFEEKLAEAMDVIYRDEKDHFLEAAREAEELVRSDQDLEEMKEAIREVSLQRVAMRMDMFRNPLPQAELDELIAGWADEFRDAEDIDPFEPRGAAV